jgi:hypothetical protein
VASLKAGEKHDRVGAMQVSAGVLRNSSFGVPYLCYKPSLPLAVNSSFTERDSSVGHNNDSTRPPSVKTALEFFEDGVGRPRLTTGHGDLDALISGIEQGAFYLFYGDNDVLGLLAHKLLVNAVLPVEEGGFDGEAVYFNHTNYYTGRTILDPSTLGEISKHAGIDPRVVFGRVHVAAAYNEGRQKVIAGKVAELIARNHRVRLLVVHNLTRFIVDSKRPQESRDILKSVVGELWRAASSSSGRVALVATAESGRTSRGFIPKPIGGTFLRQVASVVLYFGKYRDGGIRSYKATLVKHPEKRTPQSIVLYVAPVGVPDLVTGNAVPSFGQAYDAEVGCLRRHFVNSLGDLGHKAALDTLAKRAWERQQQALSSLRGAELLDGMNLAASLDTRSEISAASARLKAMNQALAELAGQIEALR